MGEEVCGLVGGRRLEAPRKEKNGDFMLLLGKFLKSSLKDSVVFSKWSASVPSPGDLQVRELWFSDLRGARPPEKSRQLCEAWSYDVRLGTRRGFCPESSFGLRAGRYQFLPAPPQAIQLSQESLRCYRKPSGKQGRRVEERNSLFFEVGSTQYLAEPQTFVGNLRLWGCLGDPWTLSSSSDPD